MQSCPAWANPREGAPQATPAATTSTKNSHVVKAVAEKLALCPSCPSPGARPPPLRDCCEVGEHVSGHHIQACFCELQVEIFQVVIGLGHRVLICRPQAGAREGRLDPAGGRDHGKVRALGRPNYLPLGTRDGGMHVLRGPSSERPRQCTWPLEPQLGKHSGHVTPERKCRSSWETQAHSWEQRLRRQERQTSPHQSTGELGDGFVAEV